MIWTTGFKWFLLHDCASVFAFPLTFLFNLSLASNTFPDTLKYPKIIPVYKNEPHTDIENYRPIIITNNFSKIFEIVLYVPTFARVNYRLIECQHGG